MQALMTAVILSLLPDYNIVCTNVDAIELNNYYDENGRHVFSQYIFWKWEEGNDGERFYVQDWRLYNLKKKQYLPTYDWKRKVYSVNWIDGKHHRKIRSPIFFQSWTQHDPEVEDRKYKPQLKRAKLNNSIHMWRMDSDKENESEDY